MKNSITKSTPEEKEEILKGIQKMGVILIMTVNV